MGFSRDVGFAQIVGLMQDFLDGILRLLSLNLAKLSFNSLQKFLSDS